MLWRSLALMLLGISAACGIAACAPYPLHAKMTDPALRERLAVEFPPGMRRADVESTLARLRIPSGRTIVYQATDARPEVLLARLLPPGGFWLENGPDSTIEFVDVSFVFEPSDSLASVLLHRDGIRYFNGGVAYGPSRPTSGPVRRYPRGDTSPADPLQDAD